MLNKSAIWTLRFEDIDSRDTVHRKLVLREACCSEHKTIAYGAVLGMNRCERIETTIRKRSLFFAAGLGQ